MRHHELPGFEWTIIKPLFTTCYNRLCAGVRPACGTYILDAVSAAYDGDLIMIDSFCVRVHQRGASCKKGVEMVAWDAPVAA